MKITLKALGATAILAAAAIYAPADANALVIGGMTFGTPVDANGSSTQVGIQNQEAATFGFQANVVNFFIPLSPANSGTYGVTVLGGGFAGTFSDSGSGGGTLTMWMEFTPVTAGPNNVLTYFDDLDVIGDSDPAGFLESVKFYDQDLTLLANVDDIDDAQIESFADGQQLLTVLVPNVNSEPFYAKYEFASSFTGNATNTVEKLSAVIKPVPIPAALPLFGAALAGLGVFGWRKRKVGTA